MVNEYDKCVANKIIDSKQCTIAFYVNDNKVVDDVLKTIEGYFPGLVIERTWNAPQLPWIGNRVFER